MPIRCTMVSRTAGHGERLARRDLDEALELRVPHGLALRPELRLPHHAAEQAVRHLPEGRWRAPHARTAIAARHEAAQRRRPHLKTYRTRTSRA